MAEKPSYIGVLNAIANGEAVGHKIFKKWAEVTTCEEIKRNAADGRDSRG